jgi:hypothetical protein
VVNCEIIIGREMLWKKSPSASAVERSMKTAPGKGLRWINAWGYRTESDDSITAAWLFTCQAQEMQRIRYQRSAAE